MSGGQRSRIVGAHSRVVQAPNWHHYYGPSARARRSTVILPPKVQTLSASINPDDRGTISEVGLQLAELIDETKPLGDQLDQIEAIWRERFEATVSPLLESIKEEISGALEEVTQAASGEPEMPSVADETDARGWVAAAVILFAASVGGAAIGADLAHSKYGGRDVVGRIASRAVRLVPREVAVPRGSTEEGRQ